MSFAARKTPSFNRDFAEQFEWYAREAGAEIALRFQDAVDATIVRLQQNPTIGRPRTFKNPRLNDFRSFQVNAPFNRLLLFYRIIGNVLEIRRLISGERDLPRRLRDR
jgi:toxin ParE1/3/4